MSPSTVPPSVVGFVGSRSLPSVAAEAGLVWRVVASALAAGRQLSVGCAVGADSAVVSAALGQGAAATLQLFCAFGPEQPAHPALPPWQGSWRFSGIPAVRAASRAGASVHWFAGAAPGEGAWGVGHRLPSRLARRSRALVSAVASGSPGSGLVAFVASPPPLPVSAGPSWSGCGSGSWSAVALAVGRGLPVFVFPVGFPPSALPALGPGGWLPAGAGVWSRGWRWASAAARRAA